MSGGRVDVQQHRFIEEYTARSNADLYASVFNVTRLRQLSKRNMQDALKICGVLWVAISIRYVEEWTVKIMDSLRVGFQKGYLVRHSQVELA